MKQLTVPMIRAVCYADVFGYPLGVDELKKFQIQTPASPAGRQNSKQVSQIQGYVVLRGREGLVSLRKQRESCSPLKLSIARNACRFLRSIPTIQLVAVTGSVAMCNADEKDDIDFLIVTKTGWLWTTRFLVVVWLDICGMRRKPDNKNVTNKICVNMFVDDAHMVVPEKERDVFSAHEVVQARILWARGDTNERFYQGNEWVREYLPHVQCSMFNFQNHVPYHLPFTIYLLSFLNPVEPFFQFVQLTYMKHRRTSEVIQKGYLRFHPNDARTWVLREYRKRLRQVGLE